MLSSRLLRCLLSLLALLFTLGSTALPSSVVRDEEEQEQGGKGASALGKAGAPRGGHPPRLRPPPTATVQRPPLPRQSLPVPCAAPVVPRRPLTRLLI